MDGLKVLQGESKRIFSEGIGLVFNRWSALQTAVENEWGGRDSALKAHQLATDVLSWFTQSKEPLYIDDLEGILDEGMLSLNVEVEDGSIEEVAENLMVMHEECLEGNFRSVDILREANLNQAAHPRVTQFSSSCMAWYLRIGEH
ncbi:Pre-rRNA-processing protein TSR2 [Sesbania bispinosa]|nr:Pre-rRNA-processing protein TSR2 [Sesbania bispinosa]